MNPNGKTFSLMQCVPMYSHGIDANGNKTLMYNPHAEIPAHYQNYQQPSQQTSQIAVCCFADSTDNLINSMSSLSLSSRKEPLAVGSAGISRQGSRYMSSSTANPTHLASPALRHSGVSNSLIASARVKPQKDGDTSCVVCLEKDREYCVVPCGHRVLCSDCKDMKFDCCPLCRVQHTAIIKVYL
jgi:hypothetical protein